VPLHRHFGRITPKLIDKFVERHEVRSNALHQECP
jgi:hypothetical protein